MTLVAMQLTRYCTGPIVQYGSDLQLNDNSCCHGDPRSEHGRCN